MTAFLVTSTSLGGDFIRFTFARSAAPSQPLSRREVLSLWKSDDDFCALFTASLSGAAFKAFFWETPSFSPTTQDLPFECVVVRASSLEGIVANPSPFSQQFRAMRASLDVIAFSSLGGDAELIVPREKEGDYAHLGAFLRTAPPAQVREAWRVTAEKAQSMLSRGRRIWISTSGLGVYWVHIRLDQRPKYYTYRPYQTA